MALIDSPLQKEIRQSKPFASRREEAVLSVLRTADVVRTAITGVLAPAGITMQQYNVLRILRGSGVQGLPTLAIGERMIEAAPGVTRLLDRMERRGWVCRQRCHHDRRVVYARIAPAGETLLAALEEPLRRSAAATLPGVPEDGIESLICLLAEIRAALSVTSKENPLSLSGMG